MLHAAKEPGRMVWYVGPNSKQSKRIAGDRLKAITQPFWAKRPSEEDFRIDLVWGSSIFVYGAFVPGSLRGVGVDFLVMDEFASIPPHAWFQVFRPALADRKGRALFIGTPEGRNHFYDLYEFAKTSPGWAAFQFTTAEGGIVDQAEIDAVTHDLDPESFHREFLAEFSSLGQNRVYYAFERTKNVQPLHLDPYYPLVWSIDFNVNPMCMLLMQKVEDMIHVLEEIVIKDAYTEMACEKSAERVALYYRALPSSQKPLTIEIYGDATGSHRRTAGAQSDWAIVRQSFEKSVGTYVPRYHLSASNPPVRDRVACVNRRLRNQAEERHLLIDSKCRELIRDLEDVSWALDSAGTVTSDINKKDPNRTHTSDALGYFVYQAFPLTPKIGEKSQGPLLSF